MGYKWRSVPICTLARRVASRRIRVAMYIQLLTWVLVTTGEAYEFVVTLARKKRTALHERNVQCWSTARIKLSRRARHFCAFVQRSELYFLSSFSAPAYQLSSALLLHT